MTAPTRSRPVEAATAATVESLSQWQLIRRRFARHRLAVASFFLLLVLYALALFAEFFAPHAARWKNLDYADCPPQPVRFGLTRGLYAYAVRRQVDPVTFRKTYVEDRSDIVRLGFFAKGDPYKLWGVVPWDRHFLLPLGAQPAPKTAAPPSQIGGASRSENWGPKRSAAACYLLGADKYGRDIASRILFGARVSLSVGVIAILVTFVIGLTIGGISGYVGGAADTFIQRAIEIINSFPQLPLWLALAAVVPGDWSSLRTYFAITIVLSLLNWTGLARVVRGKILALREEDYATAARLLGAGHARVLFRHLLPGFTSHIIVSLTLSVPVMILGETSLSFLGLGLRPPVVSWGVMLQDCMNIQAVAHYPWLLFPVVFIVLTVMCYNFLGDGLRDAADPYGSR